VFPILTLTARLVVARWPQLLALYLAGWLARYMLIELASVFGAFSALAGLLVLPLAILARLGSFIVMFLVLRDAMPAFSDLNDRGDDGVDRAGRRPPRGKVSEIFLVSIVPFFAFYAVWQLFEEDTVQYAKSALEKTNFFDDSVTSSAINLVLDPMSIAIVVVAFIGRYLIKRFASKLPRWTNLIAVYLESVWVYVTIFLIVDQVEVVQAWVDSRAAIHLFTDLRATLTEMFAPLGALWGAVEWLIGAAGGLVLLPLAWLTLAGIVYGRALVQPKIALRVENSRLARVRSRLGVLPAGVRTRAKDAGKEFVGRWTPLANAVVLIWRAGVFPMGIFVLAYTVLEAANYWLRLAGVQLIGPHPLESWWMNFDDMLSFGVSVLVEPLRIALIAAAYDFCLRRLEERRETLPGADPERGLEAQQQVTR
jgi:hypothetical protein